ncbi:response regulator transcription factor [Paenibacillus flagellatus]|uniref:DNA-binding response regulator n=1 Tax=Paenibacillus flagellatus TaxID=2211139 RepID=A0A2V5L2W9_9BACL|nr:response regulator transcription factor [Paenibacillus flagellatus]PYI57096.1 DNA-binding response regulator [Paenibacillus flagellatus]
MNEPILIVDDDPSIANLIEIYLVNEGYSVMKANNGKEALELLKRKDARLVILDVMMPGLDGLEVCRQIRVDRAVPILMLSAKAEDMDKIMGLMTGADDYMVKPFNPLELLARVRSLIRRAYGLNAKSNRSRGANVITFDSLEIDRDTHTVTVDGKPVHLTSIEFGILHYLASSPGRVFSAEAIYEHVWNEPYSPTYTTVMVHISKLRDKLESESGQKWIQTVWGVGYKFDR